MQTINSMMAQLSKKYPTEYVYIGKAYEKYTFTNKSAEYYELSLQGNISFEECTFIDLSYKELQQKVKELLR